MQKDFQDSLSLPEKQQHKLGSQNSEIQKWEKIISSLVNSMCPLAQVRAVGKDFLCCFLPVVTVIYLNSGSQEKQ